MSGIITDNIGRSSGLVKAAGGGKVLQAVADTDETSRSTTSSSYVTISGMPSVNITPASTSNKVLLLAGFSHGESNSAEAYMTIYRDSTNLATGSVASFTQLQPSSARYPMGGTAFLDSPSLDVQITYTIQIKTDGTFAYNTNGGTVSLVAIEIGA
jgi:hypothetical protein